MHSFDHKNMMKNITILGVNISQITKKEAIETVGNWLSVPRVSSHFIATPNPEMLVLTQKDKEFRDVLNKADLAIPDGIGLVWASKLLNLTNKTNKSNSTNNYLKERISGTDLMLSLCQLAAQKGYTVGLLGAREGVAEKTAETLKREFPGIKIKFAVSEISPSRSPFGHLEGVLRCDFLFVAYGAPKQEKFIYDLKIESRKWKVEPSSILRFKVAMGVGGAFDLISGKIKRAPKLMQNLGLEWLWRLGQEPKRIKRIWTATVVFPWLVVKSFFKSQPQSDDTSD